MLGIWEIAKDYVNKIEKSLTIRTQAEFTLVLRKKVTSLKFGKEKGIKNECAWLTSVSKVRLKYFQVHDNYYKVYFRKKTIIWRDKESYNKK